MFLLMWDSNLKAIKYLASSHRLSISAEALPAAFTLYLIRLDEFRGEGRATEYRFIQKKEEIKGRFHYLLFMNFYGWNVNTESEVAGARKCCFFQCPSAIPVVCFQN